MVGSEYFGVPREFLTWDPNILFQKIQKDTQLSKAFSLKTKV